MWFLLAKLVWQVYSTYVGGNKQNQGDMGIFKVQMRFSVSLVSIQITVQLKWDKVKSTKINHIYGRYIL